MNIKLTVLLACVSALLMKTAAAACIVSNPLGASVMPLQAANITAGEDVAMGTVLYGQTFDLKYGPGTNQTHTTCSAEGMIYANYSLPVTPLPINKWNSGAAAGKVYETGVKGIGIYIWQGTLGQIVFPGRKNARTGNDAGSVDCNGSTCEVNLIYSRFDIALIKTDPKIDAGTILGANLPCIELNLTQDGEGKNSNNLVQRVCFSGALNVISQTCTTPDITVPLGAHSIADFHGKGSTTAWVDSSLKLSNCPVFYGAGANGRWFVDGSGTNNAGTPKNNVLSLKLTPADGIIDSANGVIDISHSSDSASGVGIQMAYGKDSASTLVNLSTSKDYPQAIGSAGNIEFPLVARYIQTLDRVTPGRADGKVTFTINYY